MLDEQGATVKNRVGNTKQARFFADTKRHAARWKDASSCDIVGGVKKCQICGKRASIFLTQIINGQATELALCEECAKAKGLFDPQSLTLAEKFFPEEFRKRVDKLISELGHAQQQAPNKETPRLPETDSLTQCPTCQFTLEDYRQSGRLGCPDCYQVFAGEIDGDAPCPTPENAQTEGSNAPDGPELRRSLEQRLQKAIAREDYEEAAKLRDRLRELD